MLESKEDRSIKANLNMFSKWMLYKNVYSNSIIIGSYKEIEKQGRVPWKAATIRDQINLFIKQGWAKREGDRIILTSKKDLNNRFTKRNLRTIKIKCKKDYKSIRSHLYASMLQNKLRQMDYANKKSYKKKTGKRRKLQSQDCVSLRISMRSICRTFGYKSTASVKLRLSECSNYGYYSRFIPPKEKVDFTKPVESYAHRRVFECAKGFFIQPCSIYYLNIVGHK
jgi:hypothetical protein